MFDQWTLDDRAPAGVRLDQLQQQERIWFAWVCRLHEVHSGTQTAHSGAVLAIAQRRWADTRRAVQRAEAQRDQTPSTRRPHAARR